MDGYEWAIERQLPGGTEADWVEICRCDDEHNVAEIVRSLCVAIRPPDLIRVRRVPAGL